MDEMLKDLNGPWSNAACMGYCLIAMRRAGLRPTAQRRVLLAMEKQQLLPPAQDEVPVWVIPMGAEAVLPAFRLLSQLRDQGIRADMDHGGRSMKSQMKQANRVGAKFVAIFGETEIQSNQVTLKNMTTGEQQVMPVAEAINQLKQELNG